MLNRTLFFGNRSLCFKNRSLFFGNRSLFFENRSLFFGNRSLFFSKIGVCFLKIGVRFSKIGVCFYSEIWKADFVFCFQVPTQTKPCHRRPRAEYIKMSAVHEDTELIKESCTLLVLSVLFLSYAKG